MEITYTKMEDTRNIYVVSLNPENYTLCVDNSDIYNAIKQDIWDLLDEDKIRPSYTKCYNSDYYLDIPEEFYNKVKELKKNEESLSS